MQTHGVNNAMALKVAPIWFLITRSPADRGALDHQLAMLDKYHGLPNGMFSADEHLAGPDPSQGIELCAVVEAMFSFEQAFAVLGDARLADRLEKVTYNALPATLSDDMWSHQYDQQPNQIACTRAHRQWSTNGQDSNLFGLEPNFGCCTANLHQGWPKFASSLWMAAPNGGIVTVAYAPNRVHTELGGVQTAIDEETDYPFRGTVQFTVHPARSATFPLVLRVPVWSNGGTVRVNGKLQQLPASEAFSRIQRTWADGDRVSVTFNQKPVVTHWYHDAAVFERGPLVFSLPLDGQWSELKRYSEKSADWQVTPAKPWNYAVELGECDASAVERPVGTVPFDAKNPAVELQVEGRLDPQWKAEDNSAGPVPASPVVSSDPIQQLTLIPYGAAKVRITAFPYLREASKCQPVPSKAGL